LFAAEPQVESSSDNRGQQLSDMLSPIAWRTNMTMSG
jgi:hypothetical protein